MNSETTPLQASGISAPGSLMRSPRTRRHLSQDRYDHHPPHSRAGETSRPSLSLAVNVGAFNLANAIGSPRVGERVLVTGAAGSVGGIAVQLLTTDGIEVSGLVSRPGHVDVAWALGAEHNYVHHEPAGLRALVELVDTGRLALRAAERYSLTQLRRAHERFENGGLNGKVIITT
ncbi:zinc-binding dehydrogenase [Micromonospora rubida]|uniref:Zinc-binding dehydrogenase n=1 Tax=Micromonospora rubida TaxID=2697657 RepID=A0ABW7SS34_9ACTN